MTKEQVYRLNTVLTQFCSDEQITVTDDQLNEATWQVVSVIEFDEETP